MVLVRDVGHHDYVIYVCVYKYKNVYIYRYTYVCIYIHICIHMYIHIYRYFLHIVHILSNLVESLRGFL